MKSETVLLAAGAFALAVATPAFGAVAINLTTPGGEYPGALYTLGFEFSVSGSQSINALGVYDDLGNGLSNNATIGLWDTSGNLLTSTTILAGGGTLDGLFRFKSISPFALVGGRHYIVGAHSADLASSLNTDNGGTGTINPLVTIYRDRYSSTGSFTFPTDTDGTAGGWLGGNFKLADTSASARLADTSAAVPEPATWAMMLLGFGFIGAAMRRSRQTVRVRYSFG